LIETAYADPHFDYIKQKESCLRMYIYSTVTATNAIDTNRGGVYDNLLILKKKSDMCPTLKITLPWLPQMMLSHVLLSGASRWDPTLIDATIHEHRIAREALFRVLGPHGRVQVQCKRKDIKGKNKGNDPFEHAGSVIVGPSEQYAKGDHKRDFDDDKGEFEPE